MRVTTGERFSSEGWAGHRYGLIPETSGKEKFNLEISVPEHYSDWISDRMEAPVLAALFPAMALGESIRIDQAVSAVFHYHLRQVIKYFHLWYPSRLANIALESSGTDRAETRGSKTLGCFTGGVDSFYTLLHHSSSAEPVEKYRMTHGLFVHGFDIPLSREGFYHPLADTYENILKDYGVELVRCRTNLRDFLDPCETWMTTHGVALNLIAHFLAHGTNTFLIPSTNRFSLINPPIGSNPITDPQPGSESLEIIHHGCEASRIEKIMSIASLEAVQNYLRVCWKNVEGEMNCGVCTKCHKAMIPLWLAGKLESFTCFPDRFDPGSVSPECFQNVQADLYAPEKSYEEELTELAHAHDPALLEQLQLPQSPRATNGLQRLLSACRRS